MTYVAAFLFLLAIQGFLLQTAVALTGEAAPRYGRAWLTSLLGGLISLFATLGFRFTAGIVVWMFMGSTVVWGLSALVGWLATGVVYKSRLGLSGGHALLVALLHHTLAWLVSGGVWFAVSFVS